MSCYLIVFLLRASIEGNLEKLFGSLTRHEWVSATKLATDYNSKDNVYVEYYSWIYFGVAHE